MSYSTYTVLFLVPQCAPFFMDVPDIYRTFILWLALGHRFIPLILLPVYFFDYLFYFGSTFSSASLTNILPFLKKLSSSPSLFRFSIGTLIFHDRSFGNSLQCTRPSPQRFSRVNSTLPSSARMYLQAAVSIIMFCNGFKYIFDNLKGKK